MAAKKGFVGSLFDFSFSNFVTPTIIKIIYGLMLLLVALVCLGLFIMGVIGIFSGGGGGAVVMGIAIIIIGCPLALVLGTIAMRVYAELLVIMFRIAETLIDIKNNTAK